MADRSTCFRFSGIHFFALKLQADHPPLLTLDLEDLVADQPASLARLVSALEPQVAPAPDDPRLAFRLRRDDSSFVAERRRRIERISEQVRLQTGETMS